MDAFNHSTVTIDGGELLYLDTARLGRMTPGAQQAHLEYARLASEHGGSAFVDRFLYEGAQAWPLHVADRYPSLRCWRGVRGLKQSLRSLAGSRHDLPVLVASRSAELMRLSARLLFLTCRNVLTTDLAWPTYHTILTAESRRRNQQVTTVSVRDAILREDLSEDELVTRLQKQFEIQNCDGLFLTAVSNLGLRLPVERVVRSLEATRTVRFIVIDGAQDFCHVSADLRNEYCDLYLAGAHKWLCAYHPMGLGFYGHRRSRSTIETVHAQLLRTGDIDDPLLRFTTQLETDCLDGTTETVNLANLFSCQGAVTDALASHGGPTTLLGSRLENLDKAADVARASGWRPMLPATSLRSGILLLEPERQAAKASSAEEMRSAFYDRGVALTAYDNGLIRLSMPATPWQPDQLGHLGAALKAAC